MKEKFLSFFDRDKTKKEPNPERDWFFIIILFVVGLFFVFIFYDDVFGLSLINLNKVNIDIGANPSEVSIELIKKEKLERLLIPWVERENKFGELFQERPDFDFLR